VERGCEDWGERDGSRGVGNGRRVGGGKSSGRKETLGGREGDGRIGTQGLRRTDHEVRRVLWQKRVWDWYDTATVGGRKACLVTRALLGFGTEMEDWFSRDGVGAQKVSVGGKHNLSSMGSLDTVETPENLRTTA